jgi:hypothetical protein
MDTLKIINSINQEFDYYNISELGLVLNKIYDTYNNIDTRFSEFSYSFTLPKTSQNNINFNHAHNNNVIDKFTKNKQQVKVYFNSMFLFDGILNLDSIDDNNYSCTLLSSISEFIDAIQDLTLDQLQFDDPSWNYEVTIRDHINANHQNSDEALFQFPLVYYSTYFTPSLTYTGLTDIWGYQFQDKRAMQNFYYMLNTTKTDANTDNQVYFHQLPLAMYMVPVFEKIFTSVGWTVSGTFLNLDWLKRIIILYTGDNDQYDNSVYYDNGVRKLRLGNFLPNMDCTEFINNIINMFNLYFEIDYRNKTIVFETYDTLFNMHSTNIDITNVTNIDSIKVVKPTNANPTFNYEDCPNMQLFGDNLYTNDANPLSGQYNIPTSKSIYNSIVNKQGSNTDDSVEVSFGAPSIKRHYIRNIDNFQDNIHDNIDNVMFLPLLSKQTKKDNNNMPFNKGVDETKVYNEEDRIKHDGEATLMFYYGQSNNQYVQVSGKGKVSDYFYFNFHDERLKIPFASPFGYSSSFTNNINAALTSDIELDKVYASLLNANIHNLGTQHNIDIPISLVFSNSDVFPTLFNLHSTKLNRYRDSYCIEAKVNMDIHLYNKLKIQQPIMLQNHVYSIMAIEEFDVVNRVGNIRLIKQ